MIPAIKKQFEDARFIVIHTTLSKLSLDSDILNALEEQRESAVSQFLYALPDLFIFPRALTAAQGCLFGLISLPDKAIDPQRMATLKKYYPTSRVAVFSQKDNTICAFWCTDGPKKSLPIDRFIVALGS